MTFSILPHGDGSSPPPGTFTSICAHFITPSAGVIIPSNAHTPGSTSVLVSESTVSENTSTCLNYPDLLKSPWSAVVILQQNTDSPPLGKKSPRKTTPALMRSWINSSAPIESTAPDRCMRIAMTIATSGRACHNATRSRDAGSIYHFTHQGGGAYYDQHDVYFRIQRGL